MVMGINEGPMLLALENYRLESIWRLTTLDQNIQRGLKAIAKKRSGQLISQ
jgi:hypothetical protein